MEPRKHRPNSICASAPALEITTLLTLPTDLLLEIMAGSDLPTLIRCAAVCKHLRRDILTPAFIYRATQKVAPNILTYFSIYGNRLLTLVHPDKPAAESFCEDHLSPFMSHCIADLFQWYYPVSSRRGLVVLHSRLHIDNQSMSGCSADLCVYDPMTGHRTFLSKPPTWNAQNTWEVYVLLTAADDVGCSFKLLFFDVDLNQGNIKVHAITSSSSTWGPVTSHASDLDFEWIYVNRYNATAVLHGGIIHWPAYNGDHIITYDVGMRASGQLKLPPTICKAKQLYLATSEDGKLLKLLTIERFKISFWLQLPTVQASGGWSLENVIDIEEKLRSVCRDIPHDNGNIVINFEGSGKRSGDVVLIEVRNNVRCSVVILLDLETKEVHMHKKGSLLLEIDLPYRLQTMKLFS